MDLPPASDVSDTPLPKPKKAKKPTLKEKLALAENKVVSLTAGIIPPVVEKVKLERTEKQKSATAKAFETMRAKRQQIIEESQKNKEVTKIIKEKQEAIRKETLDPTRDFITKKDVMDFITKKDLEAILAGIKPPEPKIEKHIVYTSPPPVVDKAPVATVVKMTGRDVLDRILFPGK